MEIVIFWLLCAVFSSLIASSKGRSGVNWFFIGLFCGPFGLLVAVLPSLKVAPGTPTPETHVKCPDCRELVLKDARKCKHCGTALIPVE